MSNYEDLPSAEDMFRETAPAPTEGVNEQDTVQTKTQEDGSEDSSNQEYLDLGQFGSRLVRYKANGKEVVEPLEVAINKRASQGYNYAQQMEALNSEKSSWTQKLEEMNKQMESLSRYKQFDDFARENPQWAEHVQAAWDSRHQYQEGLDPDDPVSNKVAELQKMIETTLNERLSPIEQRFQQAEVQQRQVTEDRQYEAQLNQVRERFKNVDLDQVDDQGKTLEYRVLEHMQQTGIKNFESAFKDFYFDNLVQLEREAAKEAHAKEMQKRSKQGIIGISSTPATGTPQTSNGNMKNLSYDQLAELAKRELANG